MNTINITNIIVILLLLIAIIMWYISINTKCPVIIQPQPQIIYKFRPDLDLQFDNSNFPTTVYTKMFNGPNTFQGGYDISSGRTVTSKV